MVAKNIPNSVGYRAENLGHLPKSGNFPDIFPVSWEFEAETSSLQTACTTTQSRALSKFCAGRAKRPMCGPFRGFSNFHLALARRERRIFTEFRGIVSVRDLRLQTVDKQHQRIPMRLIDIVRSTHTRTSRSV